MEQEKVDAVEISNNSSKDSVKEVTFSSLNDSTADNKVEQRNEELTIALNDSENHDDAAQSISEIPSVNTGKTNMETVESTTLSSTNDLSRLSSLPKESVWNDDGNKRARVLSASTTSTSSRITGATHSSPPQFANLTHCENCRVDVGYLMSASRHHCRNCGGSFCDLCSANYSIVPYEEFISKGEQRVCSSCYQKIREFHLQTNSTTVTWNGVLPQSDQEFQTLFDLESSEVPVIIFSCAYFPAHVPFYGHMYLTKNYLCFESYRGKNFRIPLTNIISVVKPALYFLNAIQIYCENDQYFFASFNGKRDHCYARLHQLWSAKLMQEKMEAVSQAEHSGQEKLREMSFQRRKSYQKSASGVEGILEGEPEELVTAIYPQEFDEDLPLPDAVVATMTSILDIGLPDNVNSIFALLWSEESTFYREAALATKDIDIEITSWKEIKEENIERTSKGFLFSKEKFEFFREIKAKHPPKVSFPGLPKFAKLHRMQRYRSEGKDMNDRFIVSDLQSLFDIPYSDFFQIETRWVFTRDGKNTCRVEVGLQVNFSKSTWFKVQIISSTVSESKECMETWGNMANSLVCNKAAKRLGLQTLKQPEKSKEEIEKVIPVINEVIQKNICKQPATAKELLLEQNPSFVFLLILCFILIIIIMQIRSSLARMEYQLTNLIQEINTISCKVTK